MTRGQRPMAWLVNGVLLLAAGLAVFPLLWMLSVSFMQTGAASSFPATIPAQRSDAGALPHAVGAKAAWAAPL